MFLKFQSLVDCYLRLTVSEARIIMKTDAGGVVRLPTKFCYLDAEKYGVLIFFECELC